VLRDLCWRLDAGAVGTVQMLMSQLGLNPAGSMTFVGGPGGRTYRVSAMPLPEGQEGGAAGRASSEYMNGAFNSAMQSLTMQLMPQQHRLLALPPRLPAAESAALLASAGAPPAAAASSAANGDAAATAAGLRGQASNMTALTRLLSRAPDAAGGMAYRTTMRRTPGLTQHIPGLINIGGTAMLSPAGFGPGATLLHSLEMLQQNGLAAAAAAAPGSNLMADLDNSVWDEAVNQLLEALAPGGPPGSVAIGGGRRLLGPGGVNAAIGGPGAARAGAGAAEESGLDPRKCITSGRVVT